MKKPLNEEATENMFLSFLWLLHSVAKIISYYKSIHEKILAFHTIDLVNSTLVSSCFCGKK